MLEREDYEEPRCPMCNDLWVKDKVKMIPIDRVLQKQDEYLGRNDYSGAERHLLYWMGEAELGNDLKGRLLLSNELMGLYRKLGRKDEAIAYAGTALGLVDKLDVGREISGATAMLNSATVYKAFGMPDKSLPLFEKAREIYESELDADDSRLAGLYNNMALTMVDLHQYGQADGLYSKAIAVLEKNADTQPDRAITYLNMADAAEAELGQEDAAERTEEYLEKAMALLDETTKRDGYYAFVCEKCAPVFDYYGYFLYKKELEDRAERIYRNQ